MTADRFRKLALALPDAVESSHMGHPDFRRHGKIFATLGYPDDGWGMVKVPPAEQAQLAAAAPDVFVPITGAWGARGGTNVRLAAAKTDLVAHALKLAWAAAAATRRRR